MRLDAEAGWERLRRADHGILGTVHKDRGVDLVPVVYAVDDTPRVFIPIDTLKAKTTARLQRLDNLRSDARCMLLVEHYDPADWDRLWWIRLTGSGREATTGDTELFRPLLAARYHQYANPLDIAGGLVIEDGHLTGWAAR
jgi:PPOX class probable F420-dependent enzyme